MIPSLEVWAAGIVSTAAAVNQTRGVASGNKVGVGIYDLTLEDALPNFGSVVLALPLGPAARTCQFELIGQTVVRLRVFDATGVAADAAVSFVVYQVPGTVGES